ncbi:hypothetical protein M513_09846 [Trichuris suis]|uniref:Uncharacterized protein n=1 Tax=Trichuris suis TaxID=68888 RepID=A0A085LWE8_9BILA|nr:hypothetical protein M513_09846 [Trichuris suis]
MINFYLRFIPACAGIVQPLHRMLTDQRKLKELNWPLTKRRHFADARRLLLMPPCFFIRFQTLKLPSWWMPLTQRWEPLYSRELAVIGGPVLFLQSPQTG